MDRDPSNVTVLQVLPSLVTGGVERGTVEINQAIVGVGWTGLVAEVIRRRHRAYPSVSAALERLVQGQEAR